jgi:anti-sigma-K factor RskA
LKHRVLASIERLSPGALRSENVIRPPVSVFRSLIPWAAAAGFALLAGWLGQMYFAGRTESALLRDQQALADLALKSAHNQIEAERILARRQLSDLNQQITAANEKIAAADWQRTAALQRETQLQRELAAANSRIAATERLLADARDQISDLGHELKTQGDLANFKIATLSSMLNNAPQALAVAVWNPRKQEGVFTLEKMPAPAADKTLELWVLEDKKAPVSAGVFTVDADGKAHVTFKPASSVASVAKFAVSRENNDGARAHAAPSEVVMISQ